MRLCTLLALAATLLLPEFARAAEPAQIKIGMLSGMFRDVQPTMIQALAKPFRELMMKQTGFNGDVEVFDDPLVLAAQMRDKKLTLGVFHGFEYAWAKEACEDLVPIVITQPPGGKVRAMVVVNRDSKAKSLADLKAEKIALPRGAKAHSLAFFAKVHADLAETEAALKPMSKLTPEDVLERVAMGEIEAALVDATVLEGFKMLQPSAFKAIKILEQSEDFPPAVVAYRKGMLSDADAERVRAGLSSAAKTASGKMLMAMWNLKGFTEPDKDYDTSLAACLKSYPVPAKVDATKPRAGSLTGGEKEKK